MKRIGPIIFLTALIFTSVIFLNVFQSCEKKKVIKIALSKGKGSEHYNNYSVWLRKFNPEVQCIDLFNLKTEDALKELETCSGLLLTGGPDVSPDRYGKPEAKELCEVDLKRDSLEFKIINKAIELKIPILGICRGQQILNVAFGGTLIPDIPTVCGTDVIHRMDNPDSCKHQISLNSGTILKGLVSLSAGEVNSNHHQAISQLAEKFRVSAFTSDGIIEAVELRDTNAVPSVIAVQWHPERLDTSNRFSGSIARYFLYKVYQFSKN